jgi:site-specific recombinase XerC
LGRHIALEEYLRYKQSQSRKDATLIDLRQEVSHFFHTCPTAWPADLKKAAQCWLGERGMKPATYNLRLNSLRGFLAWAVDEGL